MATFILQELLTIETATEARDALILAIRDDGDLVLDGSAVREIDLAGLQLLTAAARSAALAGKSVTFAPSKRGALIDEAARKAGLSTSDDGECDVGWLKQRSCRGQANPHR